MKTLHSLIAGLRSPYSVIAKRIALPLLFFGLGPPVVQSADSQSGTWTATGNLVTARGEYTATLLPNGMVLVAGGYDYTSGALASA